MWITTDGIQSEIQATKMDFLWSMSGLTLRQVNMFACRHRHRQLQTPWTSSHSCSSFHLSLKSAWRVLAWCIVVECLCRRVSMVTKKLGFTRTGGLGKMMKLSLGPTFRHFNTRIRVGARRISEHCCCSFISNETSWGGSGIRQGCLLHTGEEISGLSNQEDTLWQTENTHVWA